MACAQNDQLLGVDPRVQANPGLEPLPVLSDKADRGDWNLENARGGGHQGVEVRTLRRGLDIQTRKNSEALSFGPVGHGENMGSRMVVVTATKRRRSSSPF